MVTAPVVRCPRPYCGGWIERRVLHTAEMPALAFSCILCGFDAEIIGGQLVPTAYRATTEQKRILARHEHTATMLDSTLAQREAVG